MCPKYKPSGGGPGLPGVSLSLKPALRGQFDIYEKFAVGKTAPLHQSKLYMCIHVINPSENS